MDITKRNKVWVHKLAAGPQASNAAPTQDPLGPSTSASSSAPEWFVTTMRDMRLEVTDCIQGLETHMDQGFAELGGRVGALGTQLDSLEAWFPPSEH